MRQKKTRNERYKTLTKDWLKSIGVDVLLDGISTKDIPTEALKKFCEDYETLEIRQYSNKFKRWIYKTPMANTAKHEKGIIKECTYYQISLSVPHDRSIGMPLHRIVYVWFNDIIEPYNERDEKMEICHKDGDSSNNHITNLKWDTATKNRAERRGAINQYGKKKNNNEDID